MKNFFTSNKFKHGTMATIFTALFIAVLIVLNIVVSMIGERYPSIDIDLTTNQVNTLSETAEETAKDVTLATEIILIGTEEQYKNNELYSSYGLEYSQVANIAEKMREANPDLISVQYVDPDLNPTLISQYASDGLSTGYVLIRTASRYKVLSVNDFFTQSQDETTYEVTTYTTVDGAFSNAVYIVNLDYVPVVTVVTGHDEWLSTDYRATLDSLLVDNGFVVQEVNLLTDEIPEDTTVLYLPTPDTDYSTEEIAKMEAFLDVRDEYRTLMVSCNPGQADFPNLDALLADWGLEIGEGTVTESDSTQHMSSSPTVMFANYTNILYEEEYGYILAADASPINFLFDANNDIATESVVQTSSTAYVTYDDSVIEDPQTGTYTTTAIAYRFNNVGGENTRTQVLLFGDTYPLTSDILGNSAFSNKDLVTDLLQYMTNTNDSNVGIYIESVETNIADVTASAATIQLVGFTIFTVIVPLTILAIGFIIFLRRRHL
ncbi:MAG: Gldg family protein [Clostridia bacterium]